jgi:hypothetical protein
METQPSRMDGSNPRQLSQEQKQTRPGNQELGSRNWETGNWEEVGSREAGIGESRIGKAELGKQNWANWNGEVGKWVMGKGKPEQGKQ